MRKFTIFCHNREDKRAGFLLLVLSLFVVSCASNGPAPTPQNASLYGAWQESVVYNYVYEHNLLVGTDTLPAMSNKSLLYTIFKKDGTFEAYTVNGANVIADEFDGPFSYSPTTNIISQTWPAPATLTTADKYNVGATANGTFVSPATPQLLNFNATIYTNSISLSGIIQTTGAPTDGNYILQIRQLTRYQQ